MSLPSRVGAVLVTFGSSLAWGQQAPVPEAPVPPKAAGLQAGPRLPADALKVPLFRQATGYSCGACALQSILCYWQVFVGQESQLYDRLGTTPKDGTAPEKLVEVARSFGLTARMQEGTTLEDLRKALAQGTTVILNLQSWPDAVTKAKSWRETWEEGHYVVLVGMDKQYLYAMDPSVAGAYAYIPKAEFLERWHDYESRTGTRREYHHLVVFIHGAKPATSVPRPLVKME
jgi:predicted double-glycine peptidase